MPCVGPCGAPKNKAMAKPPWDQKAPRWLCTEEAHSRKLLGNTKSVSWHRATHLNKTVQQCKSSVHPWTLEFINWKVLAGLLKDGRQRTIERLNVGRIILTILLGTFWEDCEKNVNGDEYPYWQSLCSEPLSLHVKTLSVTIKCLT